MGISPAVWATRIHKRDIVCGQCGDDTKLEAHHILPKIKFKELMTVLNNGILLCQPCHREVEKLNNYYH